MRNGMVIIDADGHAVDAEPMYRERLPERYRKRNFIHPSDGFDRNQNGTISKRPETPAQNLADNNLEGIDLQVIYPTGGLFLSRVREADYAITLCRTYNDWLYDWCAADRKRLTGVARAAACRRHGGDSRDGAGGLQARHGRGDGQHV